MQGNSLTRTSCLKARFRRDHNQLTAVIIQDLLASTVIRSSESAPTTTDELLTQSQADELYAQKPVLKELEADQPITNAVPANLSDLALDVVAGKTYHIEGGIKDIPDNCIGLYLDFGGGTAVASNVMIFGTEGHGLAKSVPGYSKAAGLSDGFEIPPNGTPSVIVINA